MLKVRKYLTVGNLVGFMLPIIPFVVPFLRENGLSALGAIFGIALIVFSLFGELPAWISWTQRLGQRLYLGIAAGTICLLLFYVMPAGHRESSFLAISPGVWVAYLSIVLVTLSFRFSSIPKRLYEYCQRIGLRPYMLIPVFVTITGLLGNILDGVTTISIAVVIFLGLLERAWALRASFALLFGELISNLITVAAEPTNIRFDEVMHSQLATIQPYFWFTNWPISVIGILAPAGVLALLMYRHNVQWRAQEPPAVALYGKTLKHDERELAVAITALSLLALGVILHAVFCAVDFLHYDWPLWQLLIPAGIVAAFHLILLQKRTETFTHFKAEWPVWGKLMIIFSLLWLILNVFSQYPNILAAFFLLPFPVQYFFLIILSLLSSVTDNVALASMQGAIMLSHPMEIWQMRLLFVLLTWAGGLTPFGCLQSLALNSHIKLSTKEWLKQTPVWAGTALAGGLVGLVLIKLLYPTAF